MRRNSRVACDFVLIAAILIIHVLIVVRITIWMLNAALVAEPISRQERAYVRIAVLRLLRGVRSVANAGSRSLFQEMCVHDAGLRFCLRAASAHNAEINGMVER